jgi:hypothetical protein
VAPDPLNALRIADDIAPLLARAGEEALRQLEVLLFEFICASALRADVAENVELLAGLDACDSHLSHDMGLQLRVSDQQEELRGFRVRILASPRDLSTA